MQGFGDQFLAGAAFAGDQNVDHAIADALHQTHNLLDALAGADDAVRGIAILDLAPEVRVLLRQLVLIAAQFADQLGGLDGNCRVRCERDQRFLVARAEDSGALIERLKSADDFSVLIAYCDG